MLPFSVNKKQLAVGFTIGMISFIGDVNMENSNNNLAAAICDNLTHALIGIFTWIGTFINKTSNTDIYFVFEVLLCGVCSSIIDADHFIAAKSIKLKDATSLKNRPFMHCTTLVMFIVFTVILSSYLLKMNCLFKFGWILAAAFLSHHIRDSKRRGFWIWPLGHTPPTPVLVHMLAQTLFPYFLSIIVSRVSPPGITKSESVCTLKYFIPVVPHCFSWALLKKLIIFYLFGWHNERMKHQKNRILFPHSCLN